jgi:hypothetical protein
VLAQVIEIRAVAAGRGDFVAVVSSELLVKQLRDSGLALVPYPCKSVFIRGKKASGSWPHNSC